MELQYPCCYSTKDTVICKETCRDSSITKFRQKSFEIRILGFTKLIRTLDIELFPCEYTLFELFKIKIELLERMDQKC